MNKVSSRLEQWGFNLPAILQAPAKALWHPLIFDWFATLFSFGYAMILLLMGPNALHMGVYKGPLVSGFSPYALAFAGTMLVASILGLAGLWRKSKQMRLKSSFFLALAYCWVAVYYIEVVPLPWQSVFVFGFHGMMEVVVYFRTATDPRHLWS